MNVHELMLHTDVDDILVFTLSFSLFTNMMYCGSTSKPNYLSKHIFHFLCFVPFLSLYVSILICVYLLFIIMTLRFYNYYCIQDLWVLLYLRWDLSLILSLWISNIEKMNFRNFKYNPVPPRSEPGPGGQVPNHSAIRFIPPPPPPLFSWCIKVLISYTHWGQL